MVCVEPVIPASLLSPPWTSLYSRTSLTTCLTIMPWTLFPPLNKQSPLLKMPVKNFCLLQAVSSPRNRRDSVGLEKFPQAEFFPPLSWRRKYASNWYLYSSLIFLVGAKSWCLGEEEIKSYILALLMKTSRHIAN